MKNILCAGLILIACTAQAQTLTIINQDYELAKRTAQQQHKLLIVDFYTNWCVPCKLLDKAIFKQDSMANEISKHFVVLKYDAENDTTHNLSLKHHVCSYPTNVVLTADGKLIHKLYGTGGTDPVGAYTALLNESLQANREKQYCTGLSAAIEPDKYPDFYKKYVRRIKDIKPGDLDQFWKTRKDAKSEVSFAVMAYFAQAPEQITNHLLQHKTMYEQQFGKADVQFVLDRIVSDKFDAAITAKDRNRYEAAVKFARAQLKPAVVDAYLKTNAVQMHIALGEWDKVMGIMEARIQQKAINENELNYFCWTIYEQCTDKTIIARAAQLMKENVTEAHPSYAILDTYARLLAKAGHKEEALSAMKKAISMGKASGEDTKESEEAMKNF